MKKAKWIWKKAPKSDEYVVFFDEITFDGATVAMDISVAGEYAVYINEKLVSFGQYPDYKHYKVFDRLDITPYLKTGKNELKILAWYIGKDLLTCYDFGVGLLYEVYSGNTVLAYSRQGVLCKLSEAYESYQNKLITTQLGFSYKYDTRRLEEKTGGEFAVQVEGFGFDLYERPNKKLRFGKKIVGRLIDEQALIYDLQKESCGPLFIRFQAPIGTNIRIAFGEHLADGEVRCKISDRDFSVELIANGEYVDFLGVFRRLGCRYLQVFCEEKISIDNIGIWETEYPFEEKGYTASNKLRQEIYDTSVRTLKLCAHEHYEDCPWREQAMYLMDTRNQMLCGYYAFQNTDFQRSAIQSFMQGQKDNGLFEICFPAKWDFTIPSFSLMFPTIVLEYAVYTGDLNLVKSALPRIRKLLRFFLDRLDENGLYKTISSSKLWHFYEWSGDLDGNFFDGDGEKKKRNDYDCLINSFLALALEETAKIYSLLNNLEEEKNFIAYKEVIVENIFKTFFDREKGLFSTYAAKREYSILGNALCILCGACPKEYEAIVAEKIAVGGANITPNTLSMNIFRYDALLAVNEDKYANFILSEIDRIYGYMLSKGATSFWETLKGESDFDGAGSLCHGWSAIPIYYYHKLRENKKF